MKLSRILVGVAALGILAGPVLAQSTVPAQPTQPARPAAPAVPAAPAAPARPAAPAATAPAPAAAPAQATRPATVGQRININTASADQLDSLKGIGPARAKKIIEERAKTRFKNFDDLVQRNVLPSNVEADIKDKITF
jgi:competence protein ComEA